MIGNTSETTMSVGLRRKRRSSRSIMAHMRCMVRSSNALAARRESPTWRLLHSVAKLPARVVHEDVVQGGALRSERLHRNAGRFRQLHQGHRGGGAAAGRDAE